MILQGDVAFHEEELRRARGRMWPPTPKPGPKWCQCLRVWEDCYHSYCRRCGARTTFGEHTDVQSVATRQYTLAHNFCTEADDERSS